MPGKRTLKCCSLGAVVSLICFAIVMLTSGLGISCESREGMDANFHQGLCSNRMSLIIPMGCHQSPDRLAMRRNDQSPADFGSYRCNPKRFTSAWEATPVDEKRRIEREDEKTYQYWQHGWASLWLLVVALALSSTGLLWLHFERGLAKGLTRGYEGGMVMRRTEEYRDLNNAVTDYLRTGRSRSYVCRYVFTVLYGLAVQVALFEGTARLLPGDGFRTYGTDMAACMNDDSPACALDLTPFTDDELRAADGQPLAPFLALFPPAAICPATTTGPSGTVENKDIRCFIAGSRYLPGLYLVLWYVFILNFIEKGWAALRLALIICWIPTGWLARRVTMEWTIQGTEMEARRLRKLVRKLSFSQFLFLQLISDLLEPQAYADLLQTAHTTLGI